MTVETFILPSAWASYLVNGDASGLTDVYVFPDRAIPEREIVDGWLDAHGMRRDWCATCEPYRFTKWHDAREHFPYAAECETFTFHVPA